MSEWLNSTGGGRHQSAETEWEMEREGENEVESEAVAAQITHQ